MIAYAGFIRDVPDFPYSDEGPRDRKLVRAHAYRAPSPGMLLRDGTLMILDEPRRRSELTGEMALCLAVLEQALFDLALEPKSVAYRKALNWFEDDTRAWPWSFRSLCDVFGFSAQAIRRDLRAFIDRAQAKRHANVAAVRERRRRKGTKNHGENASARMPAVRAVA